MTSKADKLPLETEPVACDINTILTLKPVDQTLSRLAQLIIIVLNQWRKETTKNLHSFKKLYISETGRRLGDRFREHLRDVVKDDKNASKPVAIHFNLSNHSMQHMAVCGLSLHQGSTESRKTLEQKFIFQISTLNPHGINEWFLFF